MQTNVSRMSSTGPAMTVLTIQNLYNNQTQVLHLSSEQARAVREALMRTGIYLSEAIIQTTKTSNERVLING